LAAHPREPIREDAAPEVALEFARDEPGQIRARSPRSSISARKVFHCARTVACSSVRSGSRRRYPRLGAASDDAEPAHAPPQTAPIRQRHDHEPGQPDSCRGSSNQRRSRSRMRQGSVSFCFDPAHSGRGISARRGAPLRAAAGSAAGPGPTAKGIQRWSTEVLADRVISARLARLFLSPISPRQGQVQTEPVKVCRVVLDGPRPRIPSRIRLCVRRRGVVVSRLGTIRISVGTHSHFRTRLLFRSTPAPRSNTEIMLSIPPARGACSAGLSSDPRVRPTLGSPSSGPRSWPRASRTCAAAGGCAR